MFPGFGEDLSTARSIYSYWARSAFDMNDGLTDFKKSDKDSQPKELKVNTPPLLKDLYEHITPHYAADWEVIGTLLGLPSGELRAIKAGNPTDVKWCCNQMLNLWLEMDTTASWGKILDVIESPAVSCGRAYTKAALDLLISKLVNQLTIIAEKDSRDSSLLGSGSAGYEESSVKNGDHTDGDQEYMTVSQEKAHTFPKNKVVSQDHLTPLRSISLPRSTPTILIFKPGMKVIPIWLKSLRLHKYQFIFESLNYDDMMEMTDETLARMQVTQGARNKILQNIKKLTQRAQSLLDLEKEVGQPGQQTLSLFIRELRQMVITPIRPAQGDDLLEDRGSASDTFSSQCSYDITGLSEGYHSGEGSSSSSRSSPVNNPPPSSDCSLSIPSDHSSDSMSRDVDLPGLITRVMAKVFSQVMLPGGADEDCYIQFLKLLKDTDYQEAFSVEQRKLFFTWRHCCQQNFRVFSPKKMPSNSTSGSSSSNGKK